MEFIEDEQMNCQDWLGGLPIGVCWLRQLQPLKARLTDFYNKNTLSEMNRRAEFLMFFVKDLHFGRQVTAVVKTYRYDIMYI